MVGVKSYIGSLNRFAESKLVQIEEDTAVHIKMKIAHTDNDKKVFVVEDIYNPYIYLSAYEQSKPLSECVICGKHFIRVSNNQKTCNKKCSDELQKFNVAKNNEKLRNSALEDNQKAI